MKIHYLVMLLCTSITILGAGKDDIQPKKNEKEKTAHSENYWRQKRQTHHNPTPIHTYQQPITWAQKNLSGGGKMSLL